MPTVYGNTLFFSGGQNSGFDPAAIGEAQYALGLNVSCRGGTLTTRPSFRKLGLTFVSRAARELFRAGKFQGACWYESRGSRAVIAGVSGVLFWIDPGTGATKALGPTGGPLFCSTVDRIHFCQVEQYLVVQDGRNPAVILEGADLRRADPAPDKEVPVGTLMAYGHGRLFVAVSPNLFAAGDIYRPDDAKSVLQFTETNLLDGGGLFAFPAKLGPITTMKFLAGYDTSTGDGPLLVMGENGAMSYAIHQPRKNWFSVDLAKQQLEGDGPTGPGAGAYAADDLMFIGRNGLRSVAVMRAPATDPRRFTNMSLEMSSVEKQESELTYPFISSVFFDNRLLYTQIGRKCRAVSAHGETVDDWYFEGMVALDFAQMDSTVNYMRGYARSLAFEGYWTGPRPTQLLTTTSGDRCFVFGKNSLGENTLHELLRTATGYDDETPIACRVVTKAYACKDPSNADLPFVRKQFRSVQCWVRSFAGNVPVGAHVSFDENLRFQPVGHTILHAPVTLEGEPLADAYQTGERQSRPRVLFQGADRVAAGCTPGTGTPALSGYICSVAVQWEGYAAVARVLLGLDTVSDPANPAPLEESVALLPTPLPEFDLSRTLFSYSCDRGVTNEAYCPVG